MDNKNYITHTLVPEMLKEKIIGIPEAEEIEFINIDSVDIEDMADLALTVPYRVKIKLSRYCDRDHPTIFDFVIKITPRIDQELYDSIQFDNLFANETTAYVDVIPALGDKEQYLKYYYSKREKGRAVMVLGDFTLSGWQMTKTLVNLDLNHILVAVRELGKFHGECYAIKESNHGLFEEIVKVFKEGRFDRSPNDRWGLILKTSPKRGTQAVRENHELRRIIPESFLKKIEELCQDPWVYMKKKAQPNEPLATICHGDYLRNNICFKYDTNEPHAPLKAMMFDFQTLRYSSPMIDLTTFMANSTGTEIRSSHFSFIFKTYHEEVIKSMMFKMGKFRPDIPDIYSYNNFLQEYANYQLYGYIIASFFLQTLHDPEEGMNLEQLDDSLDDDWIIQQTFKKGGKVVDYELAHLIHDMYNLHTKLHQELQ